MPFNETLVRVHGAAPIFGSFAPLNTLAIYEPVSTILACITVFFGRATATGNEGAMRLTAIAVLVLAAVGLSRPAVATSDLSALIDDSPVESCESYFAQFPDHYWNEFLYGMNFRRLPRNLVPLCYEESKAAPADSLAHFRFATSLQGFGYDDEAIEAMTVCSDTNIPMCQLGLGLLLVNQLGLDGTTGEQVGPRDPGKASVLFWNAADAGSHTAAAYSYFTLGLIDLSYADEDDLVPVILAYQEAVEAGDLMALFIDASETLRSPESSASDIQAAMEQLDDLSERGLTMAMFELGVEYEKGQFVSQDWQKAHEYYLRAAEHGNILADWRLLQASVQVNPPFTVEPSEPVNWGFLVIIARRAWSGIPEQSNHDPDWRVQFAEFLDE